LRLIAVNSLSLRSNEVILLLFMILIHINLFFDKSILINWRLRERSAEDNWLSFKYIYFSCKLEVKLSYESLLKEALIYYISYFRTRIDRLLLAIYIFFNGCWYVLKSMVEMPIYFRFKKVLSIVLITSLIYAAGP
jgi:hypothetical protein